MVGRGTRLDPTTGKLMFRVYDYTDATRLFGQGFVTRPGTVRVSKSGETPPTPPERTLQVEGFDVRVTDAGQYIVTSVDGQAKLVTVEEYRALLARRLVEEVPSLEDFRARWIVPPQRRAMLGRLPDGGRSALLVRALAEMNEFDLYDVLAELGYGLAPRTRPDRADAFAYKHAEWLAALPDKAAATLRALTGQFARAGTDGLESPEVFRLSAVVQAGGLAALKVLGKPADILRETKTRLFAA
jgi:type I restriction enzyme R subunit